MNEEMEALKKLKELSNRNDMPLDSCMSVQLRDLRAVVAHCVRLEMALLEMCLRDIEKGCDQ